MYLDALGSVSDVNCNMSLIIAAVSCTGMTMKQQSTATDKCIEKHSSWDSGQFNNSKQNHNDYNSVVLPTCLLL